MFIHLKVAAVVLLTLALLLSCSDKPTLPEGGVVRQLTSGEMTLVESDNDLGLRLFQKIIAAETRENIFISPLSVSMALGMAYNGARGETQEAMQRTLGVEGMELQDVNESYRTLIELLCDLDPTVRFDIANSIWYDKKFRVEQEFIDLNKTYFDALVRELSFGDPMSVDIINAWVSDNTEGRIEEILTFIPRDVVMYLLNAIYFKGTWSQEFDPDKTSDGVFTRADGSVVRCPMMRYEQDYYWYNGDGFAMLDLPYGDSLFSMTILLPDSPDGTDDLIARLDPETWNAWIEGMHLRNLMLTMPKFETEYELSMNGVLRALGMSIAFEPDSADFRGINRNGELFISEVRHKTFVKVDEKGTEAAAVTSIGFGTTGVQQPSFVVDHPFLFVIRESHSGTILFIGKIGDPTV
jgi:serpin B